MKIIIELVICVLLCFGAKAQLPEMVYVKGGQFLFMEGAMGVDSDALKRAVKNHVEPQYTDVYKFMPGTQATMSSFFMGKYEVTVREFRKFIQATSYLTEADKVGYSIVTGVDNGGQVPGVNWNYGVWGKLRTPAEDTHPVLYVSWDDANAYCKWLSKQTGKKYRLPTSAEWEYAAKGGIHKDTFMYSGSDSLEAVSWIVTSPFPFDKKYSKEELYEDRHMKTYPVGEKKPNSLGIYDMSGSVNEWCSDWYNEEYYAGKQATNPKGPKTGTTHVYRGGSWNSNIHECMLQPEREKWGGGQAPGPTIQDAGPKAHLGSLGFRVVMEE